MILADTSIWIEFFQKDPLVFSDFKLLLEKGQILSVDCIFGELLQGAKNARERNIINNYWTAIAHVTVPDLFIKAGIFSSENKMTTKGVGLIDCVIVVAARSVDAKVWTLDKKLVNILKPGEIY